MKELLRAQLSTANPRWDWIAELLGVLEEPLEPDVKQALQNALAHGNAAGAIQAYQKVRDGTVVPDLLRLLDDPNLDAHDRGNVLVALSGIPGADVAQTVTGIESRLTGDYAHDVVYLAAIARVGGAEGARALVDAVARSADPSKFGPEVWRALDLQRSAEASDVLAGALRSTSLSPAALRAVAELAGRPGASPALVEALLALEAPSQPEAVRRQVLASLAATGSDAAVERLITVASAGADYASVAASALGNTSSASNAARDRMLATAKSDDRRVPAQESRGGARQREGGRRRPLPRRGAGGRRATTSCARKRPWRSAASAPVRPPPSRRSPWRSRAATRRCAATSRSRSRRSAGTRRGACSSSFASPRSRRR